MSAVNMLLPEWKTPLVATRGVGNYEVAPFVMYATGSRIYSLSLNLFTSSFIEVLEAFQVDLTLRNMEITGFGREDGIVIGWQNLLVRF